MVCSEAQSGDSMTKDQAETFLTVTIKFIDACSADQIQLAPEKCRPF